MFDKVSQRSESLSVRLSDIGPELHSCANCNHRYPENLITWQAPHRMEIGHTYVCSTECALEWQETNWESIDEYEGVLNG